MPNRLLLDLAKRPGLRNFITSHGFTRRVAQRYVAGDSLSDAVRVAKELERDGISSILDLLGENVSTEEQANVAQVAYLETLDATSNGANVSHISVKLTQLGLDAGVDEAHLRLEKIVNKAAELQTIVAIDMESHQYTSDTIDVYRALRETHDNVVLCLQAYLKRTPDDINSLAPLNPRIRLCRGAYNEPKPISMNRHDTTRAFKDLLMTLLANNDYTAIATHDEELINFAEGFSKIERIPKDRFEFQMLYGVRRELQRELVDAGYKVRVYVPFGDEWYPYLMRRLAERPANIRFFLESVIRG